MKPLAVMANEKVSLMPPSQDPQSLDAMMQLLKVSTKLREIAASVCPDVTPA
jgi:hypothetical protein